MGGSPRAVVELEVAVSEVCDEDVTETEEDEAVSEWRSGLWAEFMVVHGDPLHGGALDRAGHGLKEERKGQRSMRVRLTGLRLPRAQARLQYYDMEDERWIRENESVREMTQRLRSAGHFTGLTYGRVFGSCRIRGFVHS